MNDLNNNTQYWEEVKGMSKEVIDQAKEVQGEDATKEELEDVIQDYILHENIDGHQWIIYTAYHRPIIDFTSNEDAYLDMYHPDDLGKLLAGRGLGHIEMIRAFWAFYYDVQEAVYEALEGMD